MTKRIFTAICCLIAIKCTAYGPPDNLLKLWYQQPAAQWVEALPIGNGRIGAMVFGGTQQEELQLNEGYLWSGTPGNGNNSDASSQLTVIRQLLLQENYLAADSVARKMMGTYSSRYLTLGSLFINNNLQQPVSNYSRKLDLNNATASVTFVSGDVEYKREIFCSYPHQLLVIKLTARGKGTLDFSTSYKNPMPFTASAAGNSGWVMKGRCPEYVAARASEPNQIVYGNKGVNYEVQLKASVDKGTVTADTSGLHINGASEAVLYLSIGTSFKNGLPDGKDAHTEALQALKTTSTYAQIKSAHELDYTSLFTSVKLDLGSDSSAVLPTDQRLRNYSKVGGNTDPQLTALLFQYGRYLMIAGSRSGGPAMTLQGLWNREMQPPWGSNYTININTEMNYWPVETAGLSACAQPLFDFIKRLSVRGRETARVNYHANGWVAHHNSDIWAMTNPAGGIDFNDPRGNPTWAIWPMGGAWLSRSLWEHYLFTGDKNTLQQHYPILKDAAVFMLSWLIRNPDNKWVTSPATSPENNFEVNGKKQGSVSIATTMDLSIIRDLFTNAIQAANALQTDKELVQQLEKTMKELYPFHAGRYGQLQEWYKDWDDPKDLHRHVSHLYGLYPGSFISPRRDSVLSGAAKRSLLLRGDGGTGWSKAWKVNWWARLEDGNHAWKMLNQQLFLAGAQTVSVADNSGGSYPNLFDAHPPFQIDGNFGVTAGIVEMLLQSHDGAIYLLPALPDFWNQGAVSGLQARGGFKVDISWEDHHFTKATITAALGGVCRIRSRVPLKINGKTLPQATGANTNAFYQLPEKAEIRVSDYTKLATSALQPVYEYDIKTKSGDRIRVEYSS